MKKTDLENEQYKGIIFFQTYIDMLKYKNPMADALYKVVNDPATIHKKCGVLNGYYRYSGSPYKFIPVIEANH